MLSMSILLMGGFMTKSRTKYPCGKKENEGEIQCTVKSKVNGLSLFCTLSKNHKGKHHGHGTKDCYGTWK